MKRSYGELSGVASAHPVLSDTVEATGAVVKQEAVPEKREAAPAELSSGQPKPKRSTKPRASNALLRKGKWTVEEEQFTTRIIHYFSTGLLTLPEGLTLRAYLSTKLNCDPMRITKKYAGASCLGKRVYQLCERSPATNADCERARAELQHLEKVFRARIENLQGSNYFVKDESNLKYNSSDVMPLTHNPSQPSYGWPLNTHYPGSFHPSMRNQPRQPQMYPGMSSEQAAHWHHQQQLEQSVPFPQQHNSGYPRHPDFPPYHQSFHHLQAQRAVAHSHQYPYNHSDPSSVQNQHKNVQPSNFNMSGTASTPGNITPSTSSSSIGNHSKEEQDLGNVLLHFMNTARKDPSLVKDAVAAATLKQSADKIESSVATPAISNSIVSDRTDSLSDDNTAATPLAINSPAHTESESTSESTIERDTAPVDNIPSSSLKFSASNVALHTSLMQAQQQLQKERQPFLGQ